MLSIIMWTLVGALFIFVLLLVIAVVKIEDNQECLSDQELQDLAILNEERRWKRDNKRGANKRKP